MKKQAELGLNLSTRRTRKAVLLDEMALVLPWREPVALIAAASPVAATGRPASAHETRLGIHSLQQWFGLSVPAIGEALFETPLYRDFAGLSGSSRIPDRVSILRVLHLLEERHRSLQILASVNSTLAAKVSLLKSGTAIDATLIAAPSSTKNSSGERNPEMHSNALEHSKEMDVFADVCCQGVARREETQSIKMRRGNAERSTPAARKSIQTGAAAACCEIHALSGLRCTGFECHPW